MRSPIYLGIDTGGTFTDFVCYEAGRLRTHKILSLPGAPERVILQGLAELGIDPARLRVVHGTTVATNALLEGKGARTAYVTNRGLKDVLSIGRQARREIYNLQPRKIAPPIPAELCLETGGRLDARGELIEPLTEADLRTLKDDIRRLKPEAVAINLLFSFLDDRYERQIAAALPQDLFISRSSRVLPEYREYERGITTWLNAYVGPRVKGYIARLGAGLGPAGLAIMRSSGETCAAEEAGEEAVHLLLSGPAGGLAGARFVAARAGHDRLLTFDMGGTSTDVSLIDGAITLTGNGQVAGYPVAVPMADIHTIGAGGGSLAVVDKGGVLRVGPQSAGAEPGPACYGRGGTQATVTDANVVLGRLPAEVKLAGNLVLNPVAAHTAVAAVARALGAGSVAEAALGIVRVANEHMAQALRVISVQRGQDPREFMLVSFGGAGGLHVCALAEALGMRSVLLPVHAGVLSALGMLVAPRGRHLSRTVRIGLQDGADRHVEAELLDLAAQGRAAMSREGLDPEGLRLDPSVDLCYRGQSYTLNLRWAGAAATAEAFHVAHAARYGHRLDAPVELVNVRLAVRAETLSIELPRLSATAGQPAGRVRTHGIDDPIPLWQRRDLGAGQAFAGPAIVLEDAATHYIAPGWECRADSYGNLHLVRHG